MEASHFVVNEQVKFQYAGFYVMFVIHKESYQLTNPLSAKDRVMQPIMDWLQEQDYTELKGHVFQLTQKGIEVLETFLDRYKTFLEEFDVYCGVDLEQGEFAFTYYNNYDDMEEWNEFLAEDRWEDLRIAVAEYRGLDPIEIVLMSLIHEGRFGKDDDGWNEDLLLGSVWEEIQSICNTSPRFKSLCNEQTPLGDTPEALIQEIIQKGTEILADLRR